MSIELPDGPYELTNYHRLGMQFKALRDLNRITLVKLVAEELHNAGIPISEPTFKQMVKPHEDGDDYYDDETSFEFTNLIKPMRGLSTNYISSASVRLPNNIPDKDCRRDMSIVIVTYRKPKPPKIATNSRVHGEGFIYDTLVINGESDIDGNMAYYVSVNEFVQDYLSRVSDWKNLARKYNVKAKQLEAELKARKKAKKK